MAAEAARGGLLAVSLAEGVRRRRPRRRWSRRSSTRSWPACAPRASSTRWPSGGSVRRSCATAPTRRSSASSRRSSTAEEIWATGYSEPSSGSDMAAAKTRAERDGDYYVVNGQKIWTTLRAHLRLVLRPRPHLERRSKWGGLSLLLMDMRSPGVEIQPIRQIDGGSEFNEVFMTDVKVPVDEPARQGRAGLGDRVERAGERALRHRREHPRRPGARVADQHRARAAQGRTIRRCASASPTSPSRAPIMRYAGHAVAHRLAAASD